ncbi:MAG: Gldg family protein, partial [Candidatus Latescibacterota bacterium]
MTRTQIIHLIGVGGLVVLLFGASLYAVNSPHQALTRGTLAAGALIILVYAAINFAAIREIAQKRSSRYGANMALMIVLFITILVVVQALSARHSYRFDLTRNQRFSLAEQTLGVLRDLSKDVTIHAFYQNSAQGRIPAGDLFDQFVHKTPRLRYEFIDPDQRPQLAKEMSITAYGTTVVSCGERTAVVTRLTEENLLNAIVKVTSEDVRTLYFVKGHGERDPTNDDPGGYSVARAALEKENHDVRTLSLFD